MTKYIICCDWGTSSLRIRLIHTEDQRLIDEQKSDLGIANVKQLWENHKSADPELRTGFYLDALNIELSKLVLRNQEAVAAPIVISGMASANIGMIELPYAELPFHLNGSTVTKCHLPATTSFKHDVILISGVKGESDVMRGEEVQAMGIASLMKFDSNENTIVLLPGTHSKHLHISQHKITKIETYITGEIFNIVSNNGLLKDAVEMPVDELTDQDWEVFLNGVAYSAETILLHSLFKIRTNHILKKLSRTQNSVYLSGLLIGDELRSLFHKEHQKIILCTDHKLYTHYKKAIGYLGLPNVSYMDPEDFIKATTQGQLLIAAAYL